MPRSWRKSSLDAEEPAEHRQTLERALAQEQECSADVDVEATQRWIENVLKQVSGRTQRAEGSDAVQAALRGALRSIAADLRGGELQVDMELYATDSPDVLIYTDAETSLVENVRGSLADLPHDLVNV